MDLDGEGLGGCGRGGGQRCAGVSVPPARAKRRLDRCAHGSEVRSEIGADLEFRSAARQLGRCVRKTK